MGQVWIKDETNTWQPGLPAMRTGTGWVNGKVVLQKTATTVWTARWSRDTVAPAAPASVSLTYSASTGKLTVTAKAPSSSDVKLLRIKVSSTAYPSNTNTDANYYVDGQPDGTKWSDVPVAPNQTITRTFPPSNTKVTAGKTYYVSVWAQDTSYNFSPIKQASFKVPTPATPPPAVKVRSAYIYPTDSGSWGEGYGWRPHDNYVLAGFSYNWRGLWFFSTRIKSALARAKQINTMKITITRGGDPRGAAFGFIRLRAHSLATQPSGDPLRYMSDISSSGVIARTSSRTITVPSNWYPGFLSGQYRGLGVAWSNAVSDENDDSVGFYGAGTQSGKIYLEWTE